jgi:hypothetical protein
MSEWSVGGLVGIARRDKYGDGKVAGNGTREAPSCAVVMVGHEIHLQEMKRRVRVNG